MFVDFNILNQLGSPSINSNTFANRPAAGQTGRLFVSTDTYEIYRDNGTTWDLIGGPGSSTVTGTGAATQVAYWTAAQAIGGSNNLWWDNTNGFLGVGTAAPSAALDIHSTGVIAALNSTGSTNNGYLAFQRAGAGVWRIGDTYNGGANFFELHNTVLTTDALQVAAATNKTSWQATETYTTGLARGNYFDYNLSVSAGGSFSSPNAITALGASLDLTLAGNATIPSGARSGLDAYNSISFTGTGTLTHNQGTQIRAYSNLTAGWAFGGSATGTITHLAGLRVLFPDNTGSAVTVTNNYGLLINDQTANTGTVTYTNRWGIYQEGASDLNYLASNLLIGSTTNSGEALQVTGTAKATNIVIAEQVAPATPSTGTGVLYAKTDNLPYYKNDAATEYNLTIPPFQIVSAFNALGSQYKGFIVGNPNLVYGSGQTLTSQTVRFMAYYLPTNATITGVKWYQVTQGVFTANNYNGVGLYSYSGGTLTLVASTFNFGTFWQIASGTWGSKAFTSPYAASAGIYFVAALYSSSAQTTAPSIASFKNATAGTSYNNFDFTNSAKLSSTLAAQTALPATQAMSGTTQDLQNDILILY